MIDVNQEIFYIIYGLLSASLLVIYIRIKSTEGTVITTQDFKLFQSSYILAYSLLMLCELLSSASFYHTLASYHVSEHRIARLYAITVIATTAWAVVLEVVDLGSRRLKCIYSTSLYSISMLSLWVAEGHYEMILLSRLVYGLAAALHHSSFESYILHEHTNHGFPDDWLTQTFTQLTHAMALIAALAGTLGQTASSTGRLGCVGLCCILFISTSIYITISWDKDTNPSKFSLSTFSQNLSNTLTSIRTNKQLGYSLLIAVLSESAILLFNYYWAPWLTSAVDRDEDMRIPYEIIFSTYIVSSMIGNYLYQLYGSSIGFESLFQGVLVGLTVSFFLGGILQTPLLVYAISLCIQLLIGVYCPAIGLLRGRVVMPELRSTSLALTKVCTAITCGSVLYLVQHSPLLLLTTCSALTGVAAYFQNNLAQMESKQMTFSEEDEDIDEDA